MMLDAVQEDEYFKTIRKIKIIFSFEGIEYFGMFENEKDVFVRLPDNRILFIMSWENSKLLKPKEIMILNIEEQYRML